jgi:ABC-type lipoprotein export system ATPase subunit
MSKNVRALHLNNLSKVFEQGGHRATILHNAHYVFEQSRSYAITGVSGTGKSTLIHMIAGLEEPSQGTVFYDRQDIFKLQPRDRALFIQKNLGLVFQAPSLLDELSVLENVMIKGLIAKQDYASAQEKAYILLEKVGLAEKAQRIPRTLSGGEQQRVALARAIFTEPSFIIADEPTAHLDEAATQKVLELLMFCHAQLKVGLIIASHDHAVAHMMDTVLVLEHATLSERSLYTSIPGIFDSKHMNL